jgi:hypothetical protein
VGFGRGTADGYVAWQTGFRSLATFLVGKGRSNLKIYWITKGQHNWTFDGSNHWKKIIKGAGNYDVGPSLKDKVNTFVGIAGANLGLVACWSA